MEGLSLAIKKRAWDLCWSQTMNLEGGREGGREGGKEGRRGKL